MRLFDLQIKEKGREKVKRRNREGAVHVHVFLKGGTHSCVRLCLSERANAIN